MRIYFLKQIIIIYQLEEKIRKYFLNKFMINFLNISNSYNNEWNNNRRSSENNNKEKIGIFNKLETEMLNVGKSSCCNNRKSFKEIKENVNYIHDNIDKYFNDIFKKKQKKEKKLAKMMKADSDYEDIE